MAMVQKKPFDWNAFLTWLEANSALLFQIVRILFKIGLKSAALKVAGSKVKEFEAYVAQIELIQSKTHKMEKIISRSEIESATKIAEAFGNLVTATTNIDTNKDGKLQTNEVLTYAGNLSLLVIQNYGYFPAGLKEIGQANGEQRAALIAAFATKFDLTNDEAEFVIEDWLNYLNAGSLLVRRTALAFGKKRA